MGNNYQDDLIIGVVPGLEDVAVSVEGGQEVDLSGGEQLSDGGVRAELLTQRPGQVQQQLPPHNLIPVNTCVTRLCRSFIDLASPNKVQYSLRDGSIRYDITSNYLDLRSQ